MIEQIQMYADSQNRWRWRYVSRNGKTLADGAEGYRDYRDALYGATRATGLSIAAAAIVHRRRGRIVYAQWNEFSLLNGHDGPVELVCR